MDWPKIIETLRLRGWTQQMLASRLGIAQSGLSDLLNSKIKDPKHSTGHALRELLESGDVPAPAPGPAPVATV